MLIVGEKLSSALFQLHFLELSRGSGTDDDNDDDGGAVASPAEAAETADPCMLVTIAWICSDFDIGGTSASHTA